MLKKFLLVSLLLVVLAPFASCRQEAPVEDETAPVAFDPATLKVPAGGLRKVLGQVLYMPIYSNLPYMEKKSYELSAFLAVHNTDLTQPIAITNVTLFNTDGMVVKRYLATDRSLAPFATAIFEVPSKDRSGTGANFLVEWTAAQPVNEPLIESVMKDLSGNLGLSFLSLGRVIREIPAAGPPARASR